MLVVTAVFLFIFTGIAVPVVEELYYRGHLMARMSRWGRWAPVGPGGQRRLLVAEPPQATMADPQLHPGLPADCVGRALEEECLYQSRCAHDRQRAEYTRIGGCSAGSRIVAEPRSTAGPHSSSAHPQRRQSAVPNPRSMTRRQSPCDY
jgi:hypothetical protein